VPLGQSVLQTCLHQCPSYKPVNICSAVAAYQWPAFAAPFALLVKTTLSADLPTAEPTNITALEAEVGKYVMYVCGADADLQHDNR